LQGKPIMRNIWIRRKHAARLAVLWVATLAILFGPWHTAAAQPAAAAAASGNEVKKITASDGAAEDNFGVATSMSGDFLLVGSFQDDSNTGSAYIFSRNQGGTNNWGQVKKLTADDGAENDTFGSAVSIDGDYAVVSAPGANENQGAVYIFYRQQGGNNNWGQLKKLTASDGEAGDLFGISVSLYFDTLVVGAYHDDSDQGSAYVFEQDEGGLDNWGEKKKIAADDGAANDHFGFSVSAGFDEVVVGAYGNESTPGAAYIFLRDLDGVENWGQENKFTASDGANDDLFGIDVSFDGDTVVVGASGDDSATGSAYVYLRDQGGSGNWGQKKKLIASDGQADDQFGLSVSLRGDILVVGTPNDDVSFSDQGSAYIFKRDQGGTDEWGNFIKLTASDGAQDDLFGVSGAVEGNTVAIGSFSDTIGANTNQGSAYIFDVTKAFLYLPLVLKP
jgi:FG-GAP repeat